MDAEKRCPRCEHTYPLDCFGISASRPDGHNVYCRDCWREIVAEDKAKRRARRPKPTGDNFDAAEKSNGLWRCVLLDERAMMHSLDFDRALRERPVCNCPVIGRRRAEHLRDVHAMAGTEEQVAASFARAEPVKDRMVAL